MSVIDEVVHANRRYAEQFDRAGVALPPRRHLAVVTCMDARILPSHILGLDVGDAHVIRNAGGRAADAIRSLVISQRLLGTTEVAIIHHTDCGMLTFTNDALHARVADELGPAAAGAAGAIDFLPFDDLEQSVRDDVALLRASPLIPNEYPIRGFVYDVRTGRLREVGDTPEDTISIPVADTTDAQATAAPGSGRRSGPDAPEDARPA